MSQCLASSLDIQGLVYCRDVTKGMQLILRKQLILRLPWAHFEEYSYQNKYVLVWFANIEIINIIRSKDTKWTK